MQASGVPWRPSSSSPQSLRTSDGGCGGHSDAHGGELRKQEWEASTPLVSEPLQDTSTRDAFKREE